VHVSNPLPLSCVALLLAIPGVWLAGRSAAHRLLRDRATAALVGPALALALWLLTVHVIAYAARSFVPGLVAGTLAVGALGYVAYAAWRLGDPLVVGPPPSRLPWVLGAIAMAVIAPMALLWSFHDEATLAGHMAIASEMQNGVYPPRYLTFPSFELRYHYGFDVVAAAVTALTRLRVDRAMDAVTLPCFAWTGALAFRLCEVYTLPRRARATGVFGAALLLFGGGMPQVCALGSPPSVPILIGQCAIHGLAVNPPFVSYFFQHPWTVGVPLALAALLVASDAARGWGRLAALGLLLLALSFTQIVLFFAVGGALLAAEAVPRASERTGLAGTLGLGATRVLSLATAIALAFAAARRLGGFFAPPPDGASYGLVALAHTGVAGPLGDTVRWHLASFGLLLPLGLAGLFTRTRGRLVLAALVAGGLLVINVVRYGLSWDAVKFATVAAIALSLLAGAALAWLWYARPALPARALSVVLLLVALAPGLAHPVVFGLDLRGIPLGNFPKTAELLSPADEEAASWLRTRVAPSDVVYRSIPASYGYAPWAGLPEAWVEPQTRAFGFSPSRIAARLALLRQPPADPDRWLAQGVRWLVLDARDRRVGDIAAGWVTAGRARVALEIPAPPPLRKLWIVEIVTAPAP
jgi:hypothetical protein